MFFAAERDYEKLGTLIPNWIRSVRVEDLREQSAAQNGLDEFDTERVFLADGRAATGDDRNHLPDHVSSRFSPSPDEKRCWRRRRMTRFLEAAGRKTHTSEPPRRPRWPVRDSNTDARCAIRFLPRE